MSDQLFEHAVRTWLEDGSDRTPAAAIEAVLLAVKTTPQERDLRTPWRFNRMSTTMRLAATIAIVAVLGVGAYALIGRGPNVGGPSRSPAPSSTASASAVPVPSPVRTIESTWTTYSSERYGISINYPPTWTARPSTHVWGFPNDVDWNNTASESFIAPDSSVRMSAWSFIVESDTTLGEWIQAYCALNSSPCTGIEERAAAAFADGRDEKPGVLVEFTDDIQAFFPDRPDVYDKSPAELLNQALSSGDRILFVAIWRGPTYAGARELIEQFAIGLGFNP